MTGSLKLRFHILPLALIALVTCAQAAVAQTSLRLPRPSQKASVSQTIGVTDVSITYSRPGVKGRRIWGDPPQGAAAGTATLDDARARAKDAPIVPYGHVWRTGANEATLFVVTDDVLVNGQKLPAGRYSLHSIPGRDEWTIIFNRDEGQWGSFTYDEKKDALRVKTRPVESPMQEWLKFDIDAVEPNTAQVVLRWEKVAVPFTVQVADVNAVALQRARETLSSAKADDWQVRLQAANFALLNDSKTDDAEGMQWLDESIKIKETFANLNTKARVLATQGRTQEAVTAGERAIQIGRASNANAQALADLEKRVAEWKAKK